jgi:hypothetical protein
MGFGRAAVSSLMRLPTPPAKITVFIIVKKFAAAV